MSNSGLVTYKHIVKNKDKGRGGNSIQKIFVHHMAGQLTVKQCGSVFDKRPASAHYGVQGNNIGLYVNESDTAWHCGNYKWNQRSIGIELSNDGGAKTGWHVADSTIETAIRLIADICKRNGIKKLNYTGDMSGNLCQHRWVASTACPGSYLAKQFKRIETGVNAILEVSDEEFKKAHAFTIKAQNFMGTSADGYISGQDADLAKYFDYLVPVVESWDCSGSDFVKALQKWLKVDEDGTLGKVTNTALQKKVGADPDGYWGKLTTEAFNAYIDKYGTVSNAIAATDAVLNNTTPNSSIVDRMNAYARRIANDNNFHYVKWKDKVQATHECPICKNHKKGKYYGWNCIGFAWSIWRHGSGLKNKCNNHVISNAIAEKIANAKTDAKALEIARKYVGINDIKVIRNKGKNIPKSKWQAGDICLQFSGSKYKHTFYYMGDGKICDCSNYSDDAKDIKVRKYTNYSARVIIRYVGK